MAIIKVDPQNWEELNVVQVDSDSRSNLEARREIDNWAHERGFALIPEHWLRLVVYGGKRYLRGICYRLTEEDHAGASEDLRQIAENAEKLAQSSTR